MDFYNQDIIKNDYFYYPFSIITYNNIKSITSLGYQGLFSKKHFSKQDLINFTHTIESFCIKENIITEFIRYNPYFENYKIMKDIYPIDYAIDFYSIEVSKPFNLYLQQRTIRLRNAMNKTKPLSIKINNAIRESIIHNALHYKNDFFHNNTSLENLILSKNAILLQAYIDNTEIAASLFLIIDNIAYYIANFSTNENKKYSANVFLLMEFYKYALKNNIEFIGLGGGLNNNDSLAKFKEQFSTHIYPIYHSKIIRNMDIFNKIEKTSNYFPPYLENISISSLIKS